MKKNKKKKKRISLKKYIKGFTLVELLAVIVILAIIMIIAIPSVLDTMETARKKSFTEYVTKIYDTTEKEYLSKQLITSSNQNCVIYDITKDLGLSSTGNYKGYVLATKKNNETNYYITLWDGTYMIYGVKYDSDFDYNDLLTYNEGDTNLSKENLAAVGECATYFNLDETTGVAFQSGNRSSGKLLTGEKEGENGWVGVYENGEITECYNKYGDVDSSPSFLNNGNRSNYCTGHVATTEVDKCVNAKSTECCTAPNAEIGNVVGDPDATNRMYFYFINENNSNTSNHSGCGFIYHSSGSHLGWAARVLSGGGLPGSNVYE